MPTTALALALAAAVAHATWNLLAARAPDPQLATAGMLVFGSFALLPAASLAGRVEAAALPYAAASCAFELAYFALLARAYARGPLSVVYPVARGAAPVLVLAAGVALGAPLAATGVAGVVLVAAGVLLVRGPGARRAWGDVALGLPVAGCIAGYTLVDDAALAHASPLPYFLLVLAPSAALYAGALARARGLAALRAALTPSAATAGVGMVVAYSLTLGALELAEAAPVAAVRESSVVIATALAALVLGEPVGRARLGGAVAVSAGIALVALG
ncbi:MAG: DMT family transporter [Actinomycetota bacterium]|nr:DMT family transporter [Actinomycetota bacterium]